MGAKLYILLDKMSVNFVNGVAISVGMSVNFAN